MAKAHHIHVWNIMMKFISVCECVPVCVGVRESQSTASVVIFRIAVHIL